MRYIFIFTIFLALFITTTALSVTILGKDGAPMVLIPAGDFQMGSNDGDQSEKPVHTVYLDAFYMDKYEVTNAQYKKFVQATGHREPEGYGVVNNNWQNGFKPWSDPNFNKDNQPVVCINYEDATDYAKWAGKRLPTEAEFEKAARGGFDGNKYVWGNDLLPPNGAGNFLDETAHKTLFKNVPFIRGYDDGYVYTSPVGSFAPNGYGLYDMAGNIWEWCTDWYDENYYSKSPKQNPTGPSSGTIRVFHGGCWRTDNTYQTRPAYRSPFGANDAGCYDAGFRCAMDMTDKPMANSQSVTVNEDSSIVIALSGTDENNDSLTFNIVSQPKNGLLIGTPPNLTYEPKRNFFGTDSFTFTVSDGTNESAPATVSITINNVNDPPVANSQSVTTIEDAPVAFTLSGSDIDNDKLTYKITVQPKSGSLSGTAPGLTYKANKGFTGTDSFTFVVNDGVVDSKPATVSIKVNRINHPPVANQQFVKTNENTPVTITLTGSDPDGDNITFKIASQPTYGSLTGTAPNPIYNPIPGFRTTDSFTFMVNDGTLDSKPATVTITVNPAPESDIIGKDGAPMVLIPAGEFQMGSNDGEPNEKPVHTVYLDAFYIDKYEVTNAQYKKFMDATGHKEPEGDIYVNGGWVSGKPWQDKNYNGDNQPVVCVSWNDANAYARWANKHLPTEAMWEKAARGGLVDKKYPWGDDISHDNANDYTRGGKDVWIYTSPVGSFPPNGYGLYDVAGNVWELCADWHDGNYYTNSPKSNPAGPSSGSLKVVRGGSWGNYVDNLLLVAFRHSIATMDECSSMVGFRCVMDATSIVKSNKIKTIAGTHGTITPSGDVQVPSGTNQTFTIKPDTGYDIKDVKIDGVSIGTKTTYTFENVVSDHTIEASFIAKLSPPGLSILTPTASQILTAGTTSTSLTVNIANHTGAWCWKLNAPFPASGAAGGSKVSSDSTAIITGLQNGQSYTVYTALVDNNGNLLNPSVTASVTFSVAAASAVSDFSISALKTEAAASGGFANYLIKLEGKNGYSGDLTLFSSDLPSRIEVKFDPKAVTISTAESLVTSQLTLTVPVDFTSGDYTFTVLAVSDSGITKKLLLKLKVESVLVTPTSLMIMLQSAEAPLMEELSVSGQIDALGDKPTAISDARIKLTFTSPSGKDHTFEAQTDADGKYQLKSFKPDEVGLWKVKAQFDGNSQFKACERSTSFKVAKGRSEIVFDTGTSGALGTEITLIGHLEPQLKGELISLKIRRPDGRTSIIPGIMTESSGIFRYQLKLDIADDWEVSVTWSGNDKYDPANKALKINVSSELGKAILVLGGEMKSDPDWTISSQMMDYVHRILVGQRGFDDEKDVYFLSPDIKSAGADGMTSLASLEYAITKWAQVNSNVPLYLYMLSHSLGDKFLLERHGSQETYLMPAQLDAWLDKLPDGTQVTIIIESCYSGSFINARDGSLSPLAGENRIIITSARNDQQSRIASNLYSFSKAFFDRIGANKPIGEAFHETETFMSRTPFLKEQQPRMDADGDGRINLPQDYAVVSKLYIPMNFISKSAPPDIFDVTPSQTLDKGISSLRIYSRVLGADIIRVYATAIPPSSQEMGNWSALKFPEIDMVKVPGKDNEYAASYGNFTIPGDYTIIISADNPDGSAMPVHTVITASGTDKAVKGDVNSDGKVNSKDAILVSQFAAGLKNPTEEQKQSADMNGDGKIDSRDTILILRKASESAAPGMDIASALLQNYPNPFNPETWIPYQLSEGADVVIRIYSSTGQMIRVLDLGYRQSGYYISREGAAYWDGRNESGDRVSSGIYFYNIHAGSYTATRKMIVVR